MRIFSLSKADLQEKIRNATSLAFCKRPPFTLTTFWLVKVRITLMPIVYKCRNSKRLRALNTWWEIKLIVIDSTHHYLSHHPTICWRPQRAQDGTTLAIKVISRFFRLKLPSNLASGFDPPNASSIVRG